MKNKFLLIVLSIIFMGVTGCESFGARGNDTYDSVVQAKDSNFVFYGSLSLPVENNVESIFIEDGPIVISEGKFQIAYRVIRKEEIAFIGSDKSPYEFFKSSFMGSNDEIEKRFVAGLGEITSKNYYQGIGIDFYQFNTNQDIKLYITSSSIDFAVEVSAKNSENGMITKIVNQAHIK